MKNSNNLFVVFSAAMMITSLTCFPAKATSVAAIIASIDGSAQVLNQKSGSNEAEKILTYEGVRYYFSKAKVGAKLSSGQGIMTASDGKVKIIYQHGDVVIVGPSSSVFVPIISSIADGKNLSKNEINLLYGRIRAVIDREGPLSGVKIKTPSAVAGVRGTDLYVSYNQAGQSTEVQVLRGEVEVTPETAAPTPSSTVSSSGIARSSKLIEPKEPAAPPQSYSVKAGEKAEVIHSSKVASLSNEYGTLQTTVEKSTKVDIARIQSNSTMVFKSDQASSVVQAEQKAVDNIVKDIKRYDPESSAAIEKKQLASVDLVNIAATEKVKAAALEPVSVTQQQEEKPLYVFDGFKMGFAIAGNTSFADCGGYGFQSCTPNPTSGGQIGFVKRDHKSDRFILQYGLFIDDKNVSLTQTGSFGAMSYQNSVYGTQIFLGASVLASYVFGTHIAIEGGVAFEVSGNSLSWVKNSDGSTNRNMGDSNTISVPVQIGVRYNFSKTIDGELLVESSSGIFGNPKIAGLKASSVIFRGSYFFF